MFQSINLKNKNMRSIRVTFFSIVFYFALTAQVKAQNNSANAQTLKQVEIVTFTPGASTANQDFVDKSFHSIAKKLPIVKEFEYGTDASDKNHVKHVYVTSFNNKGDLVTYNATPEHQAIIKPGSNGVQQTTTVVYPVNK
jgi:hypothetical protein